MSWIISFDILKKLLLKTLSVSDSLHTHTHTLSFSSSTLRHHKLTTKHTLKRRDNRIVDCFFIPNEFAQEIFKRSSLLRFHRRHVHVRRICGSREQFNPGVHRRVQLRVDVVRFDELTRNVFRNHVAVFVEEILLFLRGCDFVVVVVILRVVVLCGVLTLWVCTERKGGSVFSQSKVSTRERENREKRREKNSQKKRTKSFWLLVLLGLFFLFYGQPSEVGNFQPRKQKHFVSFCLLGRRRNASTEDEVIALALYAMDLRSSRGQHARSKVAHLTLFVLMAIGTCSGTSGFSLLTPSGIAIFALVKAKRWWCPAKSFALWIFKSQSVHKNARSSRQTTETGLDLQISHGISFASCCVISVARSLDGLHFLVVTQRLHAILFPHPTTNVASCGHISHFNFIVCS